MAASGHMVTLRSHTLRAASLLPSTILLLLAVACARQLPHPPSLSTAIPSLALSSTTTTPRGPTTAQPTPSSTSYIRMVTAAPNRTPEPLLVTLSPARTLPPAAIATNVASLVKDNGGCELPCFWGIQPGITRWTDALDQLWAATTSVVTVANMRHEIYSRGKLQMAQGFGLSTGDSQGHVLALSQYFVIDGVVDSISIANYGTAEAYDIGSILAEFGEPSTILVKTYSDYFGDGVLSFWLLLYYPEASTVFIYDTQAQKVDDRVSVCFNGHDGPSIVTWPIDDIRPLETLRISYPLDLMRPLSEATSMTPGAFHRQFSVHRAWACLDTPASLWPADD